MGRKEILNSNWINFKANLVTEYFFTTGGRVGLLCKGVDEMVLANGAGMQYQKDHQQELCCF